MFLIFNLCDHCDVLSQKHETLSLMAQYSDDNADSPIKLQVGQQNTRFNEYIHELLSARRKKNPWKVVIEGTSQKFLRKFCLSSGWPLKSCSIVKIVNLTKRFFHSLGLIRKSALFLENLFIVFNTNQKNEKKKKKNVLPF